MRDKNAKTKVFLQLSGVWLSGTILTPFCTSARITCLKSRSQFVFYFDECWKFWLSNRTEFDLNIDARLSSHSTHHLLLWFTQRPLGDPAVGKPGCSAPSSQNAISNRLQHKPHLRNLEQLSARSLTKLPQPLRLSKSVYLRADATLTARPPAAVPSLRAELEQRENGLDKLFDLLDGQWTDIIPRWMSDIWSSWQKRSSWR
jgi:hypothetical protein